MKTARAVLLVIGLVIAATLVWRAGPSVIVLMLRRVGWTFLVVTALYTLHQGVRAMALWRSMPATAIRYREVLRVRLAGEAVEQLTFTGPFLAEPAKGWLLRRQGIEVPQAFGAVVTEYLLYTVASALLALAAVLVLAARQSLPRPFEPALVGAIGALAAFLAGFVTASITGVGLIAPLVGGCVRLIRGGTPPGTDTAPWLGEIDRVERVLVTFLHRHPLRLCEVLTLELLAHALLVSEIWAVFAALGFFVRPVDLLIFEGGVKFIGVVFFFLPGQVGASEGAYSLLAHTIGLAPAAGLTLALVRRLRGLLVAVLALLAVR